MCKNYKLLKIIDYLHNIIIYLPHDMSLYYCVPIYYYIYISSEADWNIIVPLFGKKKNRPSCYI